MMAFANKPRSTNMPRGALISYRNWTSSVKPKTENGDFDVKKVHHLGTYVLPMPNGDTVKKALYRQLRRERILISNRFMATRLLTARGGRIAGAVAVNTRTAEFLVLRAKTVILCMGAAGRLGLPQSGYLWGTYENAANSGDGYAMVHTRAPPLPTPSVTRSIRSSRTTMGRLAPCGGTVVLLRPIARATVSSSATIGQVR